MDDFTIASLQESKNEWCARLINILTPLIMEGFKSIYNESLKLCNDNGEDDKILMTFQNLITRVPKWNSTIIKQECERIISRSNCNYIEDLISCVHVIQLKVLTCVRVGNKQKKIDINIPKFEDFIHNCYVHSARKIYSNVYLFDTNIHSLQVQKHKRETETIIQECILNAIRDSLPIEDILRNYMDETVEEDVTETVEEEKIESNEPDVVVNDDLKDIKNEVKNEIDNSIKVETNEIINTDSNTNSEEKTISSENTNGAISFNNNDEVLTENDNKTLVNVPKTVEHLEKIQNERNELEYDDDDDDYDEIPKLKIGTDNISLDDLDVHDVSNKVKIEPDVLLDEVEILS